MADMLSCATPIMVLNASKTGPTPAPDSKQSELVLMLHSLLQATVSLENLQMASEADQILSQLGTLKRVGLQKFRKSWRLFMGFEMS